MRVSSRNKSPARINKTLHASATLRRIDSIGRMWLFLAPLAVCQPNVRQPSRAP